MNTFYIAQISDTHLFADTSARMMGINTWETFNSVMSLANNPKFPINKIILTGDLCQDQKAESYQLLADTMKKHPYSCHWIAGNHDNINHMQQIFAKTKINNDKIIDTPYWRIILANSNLPGKPQGHLTQNELNWIKKSCDEAKQEHIMLSVHHHVISINCAWLDPIGIDNASKLLKIINDCRKVKLVIFGHIHQEFEKTIQGVSFLSAPSTSFQFKPQTTNFTIDPLPPGYRWLALHADGTLTTKVHRCEKIPEGLTYQSHGY